MADDVLALAKLQVGSEHGLSPEQSRRLRGETAADLRADANAMRAELGLERVDERERDQRGRFTGDMNARIRQAAGR